MILESSSWRSWFLSFDRSNGAAAGTFATGLAFTAGQIAAPRSARIHLRLDMGCPTEMYRTGLWPTKAKSRHCPHFAVVDSQWVAAQLAVRQSYQRRMRKATLATMGANP